MDERTLAYATYWRNSLADADLGRGGLRRRQVATFQKVPTSSLSTGTVSRKIVEEYFSGEKDSVKAVEVVLRPHVYAARMEDGKAREMGVPEIIAPLVTPARLARDGRLYPTPCTVVPRDLLDPLERGSFTLGTVSALDDFLTTDAVPGIEHDPHGNEHPNLAEYSAAWNSYRQACGRMLNCVCPGLQSEYKELILALSHGFIAKKESITGASRHVLALYDHLRSQRPSVPLFGRYASDAVHPPESCLPPNALFASRLGHSSNAYPLAREQRDALTHLMAGNEGDILAVNGPPGTGKTTLVLSVVASLWAKAALEETEPPLILASSTNNQAVTNIIDAFGRDFAAGEGPLAGRWLPDIRSFGAYFPSAAREAERAARYQTRSFFDAVESKEYVERAKEHYREAAMAAFPDLEDADLPSTVSRIHQALQVECRRLPAIETAWDRLTDAQRAVRDELGGDPQAEQAARVHKGERLEHERRLSETLAERWEGYLAQESILYSLFAWLPPVARKRLLRARLFLKQVWPPELPQEEWSSAEQIDSFIRTLVAERARAVSRQQNVIRRGTDLLAKEEQCLQGWKASVAPLGAASNGPVLCLADADALADTTIRFRIFLLTTHYWEGRWLLDMQPLLPELEKEKRKNGRIASEKRWRRRMKLTPCIVSTCFMLPTEMKVSRYEAGEFVTDYLYGFADLLIIDEAGQVLPEVAGASFALATRALVIGDTLQIEPMWQIPAKVDIGNLITSKLLPPKDYDAEFNRLAETGKTVSTGSVMRIAQCATRYHYDLTHARGMFLYEHRRCFDEIIGYCNRLCYHGKLVPLRGTKAAAIERQAAEDDGLPAVGYLHIDGICQSKNGGSRHNLLEAETIAAWLAERRQHLEATYGKPLSEIVGVVTPFVAQVRAITQACRALGIAAGGDEGDMTVGTVHSLQGAQRRIVIFSPVYSKHADGKFIDERTSMLNVAVSRAQNTFLVFGDMDLFEIVPRESPRGQLAALLFSDDAHELRFDYRPRRDLVAANTGITQLRDAAEHDAFLMNVLGTVSREVHIVTPWIRLECAEETGALRAMAEAVGRGVKVRVYTDVGSNTFDRDRAVTSAKRKALQAAVKALRARQIEAVLVWKVHSKIVIGDDNTYCVGSFNWFSAMRDERRARHETSLVYRGSGLLKEIDVLKKSLEVRVARNVIH